MRPFQHDLVLCDATIRYWTRGPIEAPTVLMLHGATLDHRSWTPQAEAMQDRFHVVIPDLRAHGQSSGQFDFDAAVADVRALLDRLHAEHIVLVGLSLGGNLAQEVLRQDPDRVRALVAADTTCNTAFRHPLEASMSIAALNSHAMVPGDHFARYAARMIATDPEVQRYALEANAGRSNRETVRILTSLLTSALRAEQDYRLPVPTLLVHGQRDYLGDIAANTRAWAQREPLAEYAVIPGAGHASNLDNPAAFTALLLGFLGRTLHPSPSGSLPAPTSARARPAARTDL